MQPVNQYTDIFASIRSRSTAVWGVPSLSVQARNFSTIQAARPAGLSESPKASLKEETGYQWIKGTRPQMVDYVHVGKQTYGRKNPRRIGPKCFPPTGGW